MSLVPAAFPRFAQFVPRMVRLPAVPAVIFDSFVQPMIRFGDAPLATIIVVDGCPRGSREDHHSQERCFPAHGSRPQLLFSLFTDPVLPPLPLHPRLQPPR